MGNFWTSENLDEVIRQLQLTCQVKCNALKALQLYHPELFTEDGDHLVKGTVTEKAHYDWGYAIGLREAAQHLEGLRAKALAPPPEQLAEDPPSPVQVEGPKA